MKLLILLVLVAVGIFFYSNNRPAILELLYSSFYKQPANLTFTVSNCKDDIWIYDEPNLGIFEKKWLDNYTYLAKAYISTFCTGEKILFPDYSISGIDLNLKYVSLKETKTSRCTCVREINYTIANLLEKNYSVKLEAKHL